ncbi:cytochrome c3 family protein [bacterium]|nr:cytochrome c3 family protein [bacterium]MBU1752775.1 cytochrome c3 family protein [bacterium]
MRISTLYFLTAILFITSLAIAQDNEKCYMCHNPFLKKTMPDGKEASLFVDKNAFGKSVHSNISCTQCHRDIKLDSGVHKPARHNPNNACNTCHKFGEGKHAAKGISCNECHPFAGASSHQFAKAGKSNKLCLSCHTKHTADMGVHKNQLCLDCHQQVHETLKSQDCAACHKTVKMYQHEQIECVSCHSQDKVCKNEQKHVVVNKFSHSVSSKVDCAKCHSKDNQLGLPKTDPANEYKGSVHGMSLQKGMKDVPDCDYCHGRIHEPSKTKDTLKLCTQCHADEGKMAKYGLSTYPIISYQESFHGIAHKYGQKGMPICTDCHNTHDIRAGNDPKASINKANISKVCAKCHGNSHPNFAVNPVHLKPEPMGKWDSMLVFWINAGYMWLLIPGVIGGMLIHVGLNLFRTLRSKKD